MRKNQTFVTADQIGHMIVYTKHANQNREEPAFTAYFDQDLRANATLRKQCHLTYLRKKRQPNSASTYWTMNYINANHEEKFKDWSVYVRTLKRIDNNTETNRELWGHQITRIMRKHIQAKSCYEYELEFGGDVMPGDGDYLGSFLTIDDTMEIIRIEWEMGLNDVLARTDLIEDYFGPEQIETVRSWYRYRF